ncbi:MAG: hypothetical protein V3V67_10070 [Myxococcota bacterium]
MSKERSELELQFEKALVDVLAHDHDLDVRHPEDALDRRRQSVATLRFAYRYSQDGDKARAVVSVEGAENFSSVLPVDFGSERGIESSAESCEGLACFLHEHLASCQEEALDQAATGQLKYGRRDDDLA